MTPVGKFQAADPLWVALDIGDVRGPLACVIGHWHPSARLEYSVAVQVEVIPEITGAGGPVGDDETLAGAG
jgi:hypothetical protein